MTWVTAPSYPQSAMWLGLLCFKLGFSLPACVQREPP